MSTIDEDEVLIVGFKGKIYEYRKDPSVADVYRGFVPEYLEGRLPREFRRSNPQTVEILDKPVRCCNFHGVALFEPDGSELPKRARDRHEDLKRQHGRTFLKCPQCDVGLWGLTNYSTPATAFLRKMRSAAMSARSNKGISNRDLTSWGLPYIGRMNHEECLAVIEMGTRSETLVERWRHDAIADLERFTREPAAVSKSTGRRVRLRD